MGVGAAVMNPPFRREKRSVKNRWRKCRVCGDAFLRDRVFVRQAQFSRSAGSALISLSPLSREAARGLRGVVRDTNARKTCCHDGFSFLFEFACFSDIGRNWEFP